MKFMWVNLHKKEEAKFPEGWLYNDIIRFPHLIVCDFHSRLFHDPSRDFFPQSMYMHAVYFGSTTVGVTLSTTTNTIQAVPEDTHPESPFWFPWAHRPHSMSQACLVSITKLYDVATNKPVNHSLMTMLLCNCSKITHIGHINVVKSWSCLCISEMNA